MKRLVALVVLTCPFLFAQDWNDPVKPVNTATPQQQLSGDLFQILNPNYQSGAAAYGQPNNLLGQTDAGVWGMDEGACTLFPDNRIFCIYGDTITTFWDAGRSQWDDFQFETTCPSKGGVSGGGGSCLGLKAMSLIPATGGNPADPTGCNAIAGVDAGLTAGQTPTIDYSGCWTPVYITNSTHLAGSQPAMASQTVSGLGTDADGISENILAGNTPNTAFVVGGNLYIDWNVTREGIQAVGGTAGYQMESILMNCGPTDAITSVLSAELSCSKTYVWSQAPMLIQGTASVMNGSSTVTATAGNFASYMTTAAGGGTGASQLIWVDTNNQQEYAITGYTDSTHITISPAYMGGSGSVGWNVMQHQETNIGKFVDSTTSVFATAGLPWLSQLPAALQSATNVVCTWGSSWAWRQSNLYLMCMDAANIDSATYTYDPARVNGSSGGLQQAYYLTGLNSNGVPSWTLDATNGAENQAIPLLTTFAHECVSTFPGGGTGIAGAGSPEVCFNIGKPSVRYSPALQRFVLTYGSAETQGLAMRTSLTPWGPWSTEQELLPSGGAGSWDSKMITAQTLNYVFNLTLPHNAPVACAGCTNGIATNVMYLATNPTMRVTAGSFPQLGTGGNWYAPYQYPVEHDFGNGTVGLYFHASAWDPYVPFDFSVIMGTPNFTISASPASLSIPQGNQGTSTITTAVSGGFNSVINALDVGSAVWHQHQFQSQPDSGAGQRQLDHDHHCARQYGAGDLSHHDNRRWRRHPAEHHIHADRHGTRLHDFGFAVFAQHPAGTSGDVHNYHRHQRRLRQRHQPLGLRTAFAYDGQFQSQPDSGTGQRQLDHDHYGRFGCTDGDLPDYGEGRRRRRPADHHGHADHHGRSQLHDFGFAGFAQPPAGTSGNVHDYHRHQRRLQQRHHALGLRTAFAYDGQFQSQPDSGAGQW